MEQFVGETFDGVVSGVTAWGVYVELPNLSRAWFLSII